MLWLQNVAPNTLHTVQYAQPLMKQGKVLKMAFLQSLVVIGCAMPTFLSAHWPGLNLERSFSFLTLALFESRDKFKPIEMCQLLLKFVLKKWNGSTLRLLANTYKSQEGRMVVEGNRQDQVYPDLGMESRRPYRVGGLGTWPGPGCPRRRWQRAR